MALVVARHCGPHHRGKVTVLRPHPHRLRGASAGGVERLIGPQHSLPIINRPAEMLFGPLEVLLVLYLAHKGLLAYPPPRPPQAGDVPLDASHCDSLAELHIRQKLFGSDTTVHSNLGRSHWQGSLA
jgi:hypothetical protein